MCVGRRRVKICSQHSLDKCFYTILFVSLDIESAYRQVRKRKAGREGGRVEGDSAG